MTFVIIQVNTLIRWSGSIAGSLRVPASFSNFFLTRPVVPQQTGAAAVL
jgi:hypothetical protein